MRHLHRFVVFVFHGLGRAAERLVRVTDYIAIGARQYSDMKEDTRLVWQTFYDNYPTHDSRLMPWEEEFVERFVEPGSDVLLIGCGSGRDLLPLAERRCQVTGLEPVTAALDIARQMLRERGLHARLIEGFFSDAPIDGTFDSVIFSYYSYTYVPEAGRRVAMLEKAASVLNPGGHVVISHDSRTPRPHAVMVWLARLSGALNQSDWRLEPGDLIWNNRYKRPSYSFTHAFEDGELEREAEAARMKVVFRQTAPDYSKVVVLARS